MKKVLEILKTKITNEDKVIIACSGGADSMALLHLFVHNFNKTNIICAHVNHNVRKQSIKEFKYVENYCKDNQIIFEGLEICTKIKNNFESEARQIRYNFFKILLKKYNAKFIVTAHHADDLMETILMRLTRGSNLSGYSGIKEEDGKFLRPFISICKKEIEEYIKINNIIYYEDYTNKLNVHTRNRYRNKLIPMLKKENQNIHKKYLNFSNELQEYDNFVSNYIDSKDIIIENVIDISKLNLESEFIKRKTLEKLVKEIQKDNILDINNKNVNNMLDIINSSKSNCVVNLSKGFVGKKSYNHFMITKTSEKKLLKTEFEDNYEDSNWIIKRVKHNEEKSNYVIRLDSSDIRLPLYIRGRKEGDIIELKNSGHKKLKDIFIDSKIDVDERSNYPIIVDAAQNVIWIPGLKKSKFDKEKNEKYDIILSSERK